MQCHWVISGSLAGIGRLVRKIGREANLFLIPRRYEELGEQVVLFSVVIGLPIQPMSVGLLRVEGLPEGICRLDFTNELIHAKPGQELTRLASEYCQALSDEFEQLRLFPPGHTAGDPTV